MEIKNARIDIYQSLTFYHANIKDQSLDTLISLGRGIPFGIAMKYRIKKGTILMLWM